MNLTDLMPYNNNSGEKHYHKSPRGLQKPITGSWRPQAIIILDLRPLSKAGILYHTGWPVLAAAGKGLANMVSETQP